MEDAEQAAPLHGARPARILGADFRSLGQLTGRKRAGNVAYLGLVWAVILGAMVLVHLHLAWWTVLIAVVVVSSRQQALLNVEHECIHDQFGRSRRANALVGALACAAPCGSPYWASRARHLVHHRRLSRSDDPDAVLHSGPDKATSGGLIRYFATGLVGGYAARALRSKMDTVPIVASQRRWDRLAVLGVQIVLAAGLTLGFGWWAYLVVWLAPLLTITVTLHALRSWAEHALLPGEEEIYAGRLITTTSNPLERFMIAPFHMNLHSEHHLFPWVLASNLPEVHRRLAAADGLPPRLSRSTYLGTFVRSLRKLP